VSHSFYITASYLFTFGLIAVMACWIFLDGRARQKELKALDAAGVRRRSASALPETENR